jgi:hypothetical protein
MGLGNVSWIIPTIKEKMVLQHLISIRTSNNKFYYRSHSVFFDNLRQTIFRLNNMWSGIKVIPIIPPHICSQSGHENNKPQNNWFWINHFVRIDSVTDDS